MPSRPARKRKSPAPRKGARAMWKGRIVFGSIDVPVKLYSAVEDKSIHFRLLDRRREEPVVQRMIDPGSGGVVPAEKVQSAYETKSGDMVLIAQEEIASAEPKESRDIEVRHFVDDDAIASPWYDRPYYLGPDEESSSAYFALARALADRKKQGVAHWVMRRKEYSGALKAEGDYLVLITLRRAGEVVPASSLPVPEGKDLAGREVTLATQLVETMRETFDITRYRDTYRERVLELVRAKAAGKVLEFPKAKQRAEPRSLAAALEKSLAAARKTQSA